ncbi:HNH endonuclease [Salibacterium lacus]|uniref:Putative HNH nuclease YajD n=1 Tax=Salibacterium lacus TaxID=1898109 RepID=A0ABW5SYA7_9BACI
MPRKPKKPCSYPRCSALTYDRFCDEHKTTYTRQADKKRGTATQRGYDARWRKARAWYLKRHSLCVHCRQKNRYTPADVVDHIMPHRGDYGLFWDEENWQSLCKACHDKKTAKEE